jgi:hypothetical protein
MRVKVYNLLDLAIKDGINGGWQRAHKHTDDPGEEHIAEQIHHYIMLAISEYFDFEDEFKE